ncbi:putative zinc-binding protein [Carboxydothermus pertinax]|uniref:Zinc-binding protein n=1 Tax=Carboxydothermus pertinax TaxID=870242 RepID=A0A1L8CV08_9THEO|nr:putative zinc-binding protein [Carboxydothermus pertinax]GAV22756.1 hypothetical protein cpu_12660 [Carboxydothermus pertinax]
MKNYEKIAVTPCAGIGQIFGAITREAAYKLVEELYPDNTVLVCLPALATGVQEDIDFINDYPVLVLNGCKDRCATKAVMDKGGKVDFEVYLPDVLREEKLSLAGEKRSRLGDRSRKAIDALAARAATIIKENVRGIEKAV